MQIIVKEEPTDKKTKTPTNNKIKTHLKVSNIIKTHLKDTPLNWPTGGGKDQNPNILRNFFLLWS